MDKHQVGVLKRGDVLDSDDEFRDEFVTYEECQKGKIFCGKKVFELIKDKIAAPVTEGNMFYGDVTFILHEYLEPNAVITTDPVYAELFKQLKQNYPEGDKMNKYRVSTKFEFTIDVDATCERDAEGVAEEYIKNTLPDELNDNITHVNAVLVMPVEATEVKI